jgi:hypothetical protein
MTIENFPTNPTESVVNTSIDGIFKIGVNLAEKAIVVQVPFLGLPVINSIFNGIVGWLANQIYQQFAKFVDFGIIDLQVGTEEQSVAVALAALKAAQAGGDEVAIQKALQNFGTAVGGLTNLQGSSNPGSM